MKNLLYIGNKLSNKGKTVTSIETLGRFLAAEGFIVKTASSKTNKFFRMVDMLQHVFRYRKATDFVLIDTYSTSNFYYALFVSQLCRFLKLKYIPILRGGNLPNRLKSNPKLSNAIFNHAFKNVAPSKYTQSNFEALGYSNLICIPNSIKIENYSFEKRNFNKVKLLWVRSFSEIYNPLLAVKIVKSLKDENVEAELCMVGPDNDGSLEEVKNYAKKLKVKVTFTGKLSKTEWIDLSKNYNFFINTTNFDNMPVSVIEAMALGLPVVSTNIGGMPFLIENDKDGILVEPNKTELFVTTIKQIIKQPEFANTLAINAREKAEMFDWQTIKHKWVELLQ
ncbi:glycosyltransferase family 4 protein [Sabulilitoribacter arenilitoris]|uniref:Glycosyltransferase family 4 protein n=1 Tax=Wocania arenilitoris TaxID=2044858 RepID=A0AAE3EQ34_9FLAO|nr:glycosyltransferase family 4 protein [Wocania arenilitoris]MCF7568977.1 glycosyltransferase family 4 protein [Wocania arenilitoris]